jgi:hypothetical protein
VLPTTPNRAGVLANSNEPTDAILLNGATPPRAGSEATTHDAAATVPVSYVLDGSLRDLEPHLGHHVEVTGTLQTVNEGAKDANTMVRHIRVASIKMIATECATQKSSRRSSIHWRAHSDEVGRVTSADRISLKANWC